MVRWRVMCRSANKRRYWPTQTIGARRGLGPWAWCFRRPGFQQLSPTPAFIVPIALALCRAGVQPRRLAADDRPTEHRQFDAALAADARPWRCTQRSLLPTECGIGTHGNGR
jgi:hypothetical protein